MAGALDLEDLVEDTIAELTVPGATSPYANATTAQWVAQLRNAFWEAYLDKVISGYTESDGIVTPKSGDTKLPRELQQILVFYAGLKVIKNRLMDLKTEFRAKGGAAEYEVKQSAQVLNELFKSMIAKRDLWLQNLSTAGISTTFYIDSIAAREYGWLNDLGNPEGWYS